MKTEQRNILAEIVERRLELVAQDIQNKPIEAVKAEIDSERPKRRFFTALKQDFDAINIIAEIKRRSPSKGIIKESVDAAETAKIYEEGGACAISVLTEPDYFNGSLEDLRSVKKASTLPVLRKDFIVTEYQIYESAAANADAVLLIAGCLEDRQLSEYYHLAREIGLDVLVEIHDETELSRISDIDPRIVGINNRNLKTFETSVSNAISLASKLERYQLPVALSGINTIADVQLSKNYGISNFLIGESIMRSTSPVEFIRDLRGKQ
ncbi:Indole-3-glycerol phosphate synthase [Sedimentisphaera cyanobacteriorum]|uniref:Indole-3-glycerol phosphate synthase n=1 Tax=Sedimentisphaera cyanobacteriorum TaxID=1940790 RepID=A0A1Q2HLW6_9BACT|nr:indole-3-glycerol phosphate synthase TrpC [Sedimentisphaera cyanobacteriorum]AQQ08432.1 Indole-3-glycerol phosphate synthase [Sedimentisphaera cyanobacteriorum]